MQDILGESLRIFKKNRIRKMRMIAVVLILSLVVSLDVFWALRQPGLTLAGDADCRIQEHTHDDLCQTDCALPEHVHSMACYSDITADVESPLDWQNMFDDYPYTGDLRQDLAGIAKTQVGYRESTLNFEVDDNGIRRGYTRYGAWYGTPYRDWSAMFVSFCLNYAGADPGEFPGNTGADSMATTWDTRGKYAPAETHSPVAGDLVFFTDNSVGIVTEVQNATLYVICGDVDDAVCGTPLSLTDESIAGWGITEAAEPVPEGDSEETEPDIPSLPPETTEAAAAVPEIEEMDYPDISNGPVFRIFAGGRSEPESKRSSLKAPRTVVDIYDYLTGTGGGYFITLLDTNNNELPKDENGNYIVTSGTSYKMSMTFKAPNGIPPGTYQYQLPPGLQVNGGAGEFILNDNGTEVKVGTWEVGDDGLITMVFNEQMNNRTDVLITATMGVVFPKQDEPMEFDGKIIVTIEPPSQTEEPTVIEKWGAQGTEKNGQDPSKIYWTVKIVGKKDSHIPGSIVTDQISLGDHSYTESDINAGLRFVIAEPNPEPGADPIWHNWMVYPGDLKLSWNENGWTYEMPESIVCGDCGRTVTLGNNGWEYYVHYTSTPVQWGITGNREYMNLVTVDGRQQYGWVSFSHGQTHADIIKNGSFHGDAEGGVFLWEIQAVIPGIQEGQKADYYWYIMDYLRVHSNEHGFIGYIQNDADRATVTAIHNGNTITVPNIKDATAADPFAWKNSWSESADGVYYVRELEIFCRCTCTEETCSRWNADTHKCGNIMVWDNPDFCQCWVAEGDTLFTFSYQTDDPAIVEAYGGQNYSLHNEAVLYNKIPKPDWNDEFVRLDGAEKNVPIPGVFKKVLTNEFDGYTAHYKVTVNEAKLSLTNGSPLTIHDEMTQTLAYISGSLVITTEDANGNIGTLQQGVDYTVTYDGTGDQTDATGNPVHVLDIVILQPQPVMYLLDYDTTLIIPDNITEAVKYSNSATITLWGKDMTDESEEKVFSEINISAKTYRVQLSKTESQEGKPLEGAAFGLFNAQGGLITDSVTDAGGNLLFETNITQGIILREHVLYYMQEQKSPPGYRLDDTKYWFCFCNNKADSCETCAEVMAGLQAVRIPSEQLGTVEAVNELMHYDLPSTGGPGIYPLMLARVMCIVTPLVYGFIRRRKQERRGDG